MYVAIDVGGTKTLLATFSEDGKKIKQQKFLTPETYYAFTEQLNIQIQELCDGERPKACAVALPAAINRDQGVAEYFGNLAWTNVPIRDDLEKLTSSKVYVENDAKLAGLAEATELADLYHRVLYVTVSTGIGLGLIVDGKIDYTVHDAGGRAIMLEHNGKVMPWEEFASGKAIVRQTGKMASEITDESDWQLVSRNLAVGLIDLIVTLSPDCIVIGGGVGTHLPKFYQQLHDELEFYRSRMLNTMPQIVQAKHPEEAVIYGGFLLCKQHAT